jgi:hypothetical protein
MPRRLLGKETDLLWRKFLAWRPGQLAKLKRGVRRRERREGKQEISNTDLTERHSTATEG